MNLDAWGAPPQIRSFQGGHLRGITQNLDHIQSLGVNCLYLTPVFLSTANHRYHPSDFLKVDPMLGGEDAFRELVDECHARGMRFVLDGVFNHTGRGHWAFTSLLDAQEQSPYRDWFLPKSFPVRAYDVERYHVNYECWWDLPDLPKLNFDNAGVRQHVLDIGRYWVKEFNIDGWRLDYPIEIPPAFWKEYRAVCREEAPHVVTVGELFGINPQAVGEGGHFDSLMNYSFGTCALGFVGGGVELRQDDAIGGDYQVIPLDADGFRAEYSRVCGAYQSAHADSRDGGLGAFYTLVPIRPRRRGERRSLRASPGASLRPPLGFNPRPRRLSTPLLTPLNLTPTFARMERPLGFGSAHPSMLMNLFDSHDTARAMWMLGGDGKALRLLILMMACAPGPPMMYQGTEVGQIGALGLEGSGRDPHNREAFPWHKKDEWDAETLSFVRATGRMRNDTYALRRGGLRWRDARGVASGDPNPALIVWERFFDDATDGDDALCVFHAGRGNPSGPTTVDTGFGPCVKLFALIHSGERAALGEDALVTDADGRITIDMDAQSGLVLVPARG
jgi:glycosidase